MRMNFFLKKSLFVLFFQLVNSMEPRTLKNSVPLRAERSTLFSGDRYNNNGSPYQGRSRGRSVPIADHQPTPTEHEPTPRNSETVKNCQMCKKKFIRMFRPKKECHGCGVITCCKCFTEGCRCLNTTSVGSRVSEFNSSVPLSLLDLKSYEKYPRFWECKLAAPTSIFRCRDREISANLSIGDDAVVNFRTQLTPSMSCTCGGGISKKSFQTTEFHFDALRNQKFSRWTKASFIMNYLAVGETWLFVSLSGLTSTFYGVTKINIRRLQKFRRVIETLNIYLRNEDGVTIRLRGSLCWKIYNEEFDGPAPISSSPPRSYASISDSDRTSDRRMSIKLEPTLNELRSFYESYLFMEKDLELKLLEETLDSPRTADKMESRFHYSGYTTESNHTQYIKPLESPRNSLTAITPQADSRKDYQDAKKTTRVREILKIMDFVSKKHHNSNHLLSLLCPLCSKPVNCLNKSPSREVKNIPYQKDTLSCDQRSRSTIDLLD